MQLHGLPFLELTGKQPAQSCGEQAAQSAETQTETLSREPILATVQTDQQFQEGGGEHQANRKVNRNRMLPR
jgi:hypothetical protein